VNRSDFATDTLVVLGHGTTQNDNSAAPVYQHAAELRKRNLFAEVREAFWKQSPQVQDVLSELKTPRVFIAPLFMSEGYFSVNVIPQALGFTGIDFKSPRPGWFYCKPVGTHPQMADVLSARAADVVARFPFPREPKPSDITLFVAGHGTDRDPNSRKIVDSLVEAIRQRNIYHAVHAIFLDEEPRIPRVFELCATRNAVVIPFLVSDGLHVTEDIPVLLGEAERVVKERLAAGQPTWRNPTEKQGKLIWYSGAVGTDSRAAEVILERVREAATGSKTNEGPRAPQEKS
jgi:sirohydrochlorin cobaltochelatase